MALLKDWFGWEGPFTAEQRRTEESHQDNRARIEQWIKSSGVQDKLRKAQKDAINEGRSIYGGRGGRATVSPMDKLSDKARKLAAAKKNLSVEDELPDAFVPYFKGERDKIAKEFEYITNPPLTEPELKGGMSDRVATDNRGLFSGTFPGEVLTSKDVHRPDDSKGISPFLPGAEFFQTPTAAFPEDTVPKTLSQIGITAKDDMQTFQELEKKLPDMDLRQAYQADPKGFAMIMKALKSGKAPNGKPFGIKDAIALLQASQ